MDPRITYWIQNRFDGKNNKTYYLDVVGLEQHQTTPEIAREKLKAWQVSNPGARLVLRIEIPLVEHNERTNANENVA